MPGVVGLDLSLRSAAACWLPKGWTGDTTKLRVKTFGYELGKDSTHDDRIVRMIAIADGVVAFCKKLNPTVISVEDHAFGAGGANATQTHEMTGVVKAAVYRAFGSSPVPVASATARKTLLQKLPRRDVKAFTERNVRLLGGEALYWNGDELDAFVVGNHAMMLEGGVPLSFLGT